MTPAEICAEVDTFDDAYWVTQWAGRMKHRQEQAAQLTEEEAKDLLCEYWRFMNRLLRDPNTPEGGRR